MNGQEVSGGSESKPRKGYICLESEGSECHFRNLRIREWPSTNPTPDEIAPLAQGFQPLYTGIDLSGWKMEPGHAGHWRTNDWMLAYDGESTATLSPGRALCGATRGETIAHGTTPPGVPPSRFPPMTVVPLRTRRGERGRRRSARVAS